MALLARDPEWLFAHWSVDPDVIRSLGEELGERVAALATLTLRIQDPVNGGSREHLVARDARSCWLHTDPRRRPYRAELGLTLPSGEYRPLAGSDAVVPPGAPATHEVARVVRYHEMHGARPAGRDVLLADEIRALAPAPPLGAAPVSRAEDARLLGGASDLGLRGGASEAPLGGSRAG